MLVFEEIKELLKKVGDKNSRHVFYNESVKIADDIKVLYSEDYPKFLDLNRPKETTKDKNYRKAVYNNPVKSHYGRIVDKKMSIKNSQDYLINYPLDTTGNNPLKDYCESRFGGFGNITDWTFSIAVINESTDPNAVMCVIDKNPPERQTESYKPFPYIFASKDVLFFERNKYCVLKEDNPLNKFTSKYYIIDDVNYWIFEEKENGGRILTDYIGPIPHFCGEMPAKKIGKYIKQQDSATQEVLLESIFSYTLTDFKRAITRSSDLEVALVHHIHPLDWMMAPKKCQKCNGKGTFAHKDNPKETCDTCNGKGSQGWDALNVMEIDIFQDKWLDGKGTFPFSSPAGTAERNVEAVIAVDTFFNKAIDDAYGSIDFGILRKKDINAAESGEAKKYNRLDYEKKVHSEGEHIIKNIQLPIFKWINSQLFGFISANTNYVPEITIPISFDILSPEMILEELKVCEDAGVSKEIKGALEIKYSKLVFGDKSRETQTLLDEINLNPQFGKDTDSIVSFYGTGQGTELNGISEIDYIINASFKSFIDRAYREYPNWISLSETEKMTILVGYANELIQKRVSMPVLPNLNVTV